MVSPFRPTALDDAACRGVAPVVTPILPDSLEKAITRKCLIDLSSNGYKKILSQLQFTIHHSPSRCKKEAEWE